MFLLIELGVAYLLADYLSKIPKPSNDDSNEIKANYNKHEEDKVHYRGFILNVLSNQLYDLFHSLKSPQEI